MDKKYLTEKIKFYTETVKVFYGLSAIVGGGIATLLVQQLNSLEKISLFIVGFLFEIFAIIFIRDMNSSITGYIEQLKGKKL